MSSSVSSAAPPAYAPADLVQHFRSLYSESCRLYRAPGRINLIGEHTDYNDGFVLPAAVNFYCWTAICPTKDRKIEVHSTNFKERSVFHLDHPKPLRNWSDYVQGVALMLEEAGFRLPGARILVSSEVPIGSGLSSSAALEVAAGMALLKTQRASWNLTQLAQACQRAENEFVGARCGIMDQFIACYARTGHAVLLDCRSLEHRFVPLPDEVRIVICNTMVKHSHAAGEYNTRRSQCEEGVRVLSRVFPTLKSLRGLTLAEFEPFQELLPREIRKRCRHVITENRRVLDAAAALEQGNLNRLDELMAESHRSLREDYDVSSPELDLMVDLAKQAPGICGARMTGGGFGGCTVNLVRSDSVQAFQDKVAAGYHERIGIVPEIYVSPACNGAERWNATA